MTTFHRRGVLAGLAAASVPWTPSQAAGRRTVISIRGNGFLVNGKPTFPGRSYKGRKVDGLLFTSRMANAIVDDQNPATRGVWVYSDGPWDPERNTAEFITALPLYYACGLNSVAINLQGGSPQGYSWIQPWHLSGFDADGHLRTDYRQRLEKVLTATDTLGMAVILGLFYVSAKPALRDDAAVARAVDEVVEFLCAGRHTNVLIEVGNEIDLPGWKLDIIKPERCHELAARIQKASHGHLPTPARRLLVSTSVTRRIAPPDNLLAVADYVLLHGNGCDTPDMLRAMIGRAKASAAYRGQPLVINEDDHYDFDRPDNNFLAAVEDCCGWGFFDYRRDKEGYAAGYQSLPVDWGINSQRKKAFFAMLKEVTGGLPEAR